MTLSRTWFPRFLSTLAIGVAIAACGGAGRWLSDVETSTLFGRQTNYLHWCQYCNECWKTNVECREDNGECEGHAEGWPCGWGEYHYFSPENCPPNGTWGSQYCDPTAISAYCLCRDERDSCVCKWTIIGSPGLRGGSPQTEELLCCPYSPKFVYKVNVPHRDVCFCPEPDATLIEWNCTND